MFAERAASPSIAHVKDARDSEPRDPVTPVDLETSAGRWERPRTHSPLRTSETDEVLEETRRRRKQLQDIMFDYVSGKLRLLT